MGCVCPAPWEPERRGALGVIPAWEEWCVQASWLPAVQVAWWVLSALSAFISSLSGLCVYLDRLLTHPWDCPGYVAGARVTGRDS